jgi:hypothetical protein
MATSYNGYFIGKDISRLRPSRQPIHLRFYDLNRVMVFSLRTSENLAGYKRQIAQQQSPNSGGYDSQSTPSKIKHSYPQETDQPNQ